MAFILNIETSTEVCSVAVAKDGETLFIKEKTEGLSHAEWLTAYIEELFRENYLQLSELDAIAVSKGPGSYTGLRIGTSAAKGICYALDIPLISACSLDILGIYTLSHPAEFSKEAPTPEGYFCPMIDARRMEVYTALYKFTGEQVLPVRAEIIDENSFTEILADTPIWFFGNGSLKCREKLNHPNALFEGPARTSAKFMEKLAEEKFRNNLFEDVAYFEPFYLKDFVASVPKNKIF